MDSSFPELLKVVKDKLAKEWENIIAVIFLVPIYVTQDLVNYAIIDSPEYVYRENNGKVKEKRKMKENFIYFKFVLWWMKVNN